MVLKREEEGRKCSVRSEGLEVSNLAASKTDLYDLRGEDTRSVIYRQLYVRTVEVQMAEYFVVRGPPEDREDNRRKG